MTTGGSGALIISSSVPHIFYFWLESVAAKIMQVGGNFTGRGYILITLLQLVQQL